MRDELKKRRQLEAVQRYRVLQQEKTELAHMKASQALSQAKALWQQEQGNYSKVLGQLLDISQPGASLDPVLQQSRLVAMMQMRESLESRGQQLEAEQQKCRLTLAELVKSKVDVDVVDSARKHLEQVLASQYRAQELADIFDAQMRKGAYQ